MLPPRASSVITGFHNTPGKSRGRDGEAGEKLRGNHSQE